jgi:hypothetical protein
MSLKQGDKVEAIIEIDGGMFKSNVKKGAKGTVLSVNFSGTKAKVHFESAGLLWPAVDLDNIKVEYLKKRY